MAPSWTDDQRETEYAATFNTTHWSVVLMASQEGTPQAREALERLCSVYWFPLYAYVRRRGYLPEEAEDLTQDFFARLLSRKHLANADPAHGRFRSYLLTALKHFLINEWHRQQAGKRGGGQKVISLDGISPESRYLREATDPATPETLYERQWAFTVLEQVTSRLRADYAATGKADLFEVLKEFLLDPKPTPHAKIANRIGVSINAVSMAIHRLRQRFGELLREEIARTVSDPAEIEEEIRHLISVIGR